MTIDVERAQAAVRDLLAALGVDASSEDLRETPRRVAQTFRELLSPSGLELTTFPNDEGYNQLIVLRDIEVHSLCAHHLMPFTGVAHVGYLPADRIVGLSKLARVVDHFARALQIQERLTQQVGSWLCENLEPKGVGVVVEAEHTCMTVRGARKAGSRMVTSALYGLVRDDPRTRSEFLAFARPTA